MKRLAILLLLCALSVAAVTNNYHPVDTDDDGLCNSTDPIYPGTVDWCRTDLTSIPIRKAFDISSSGVYNVTNGLMRFDTSDIPNLSTVTAASLYLYVNSKVDTDNRILFGEWYSTSNWPITSDDWITLGLSDAFSQDITGIATGGYVAFSLTTPTNVSKTGFTGFRLTISGIAPLATNTVDIDQFNGSNPPYIEVTYTPASGPTINVTETDD